MLKVATIALALLLSASGALAQKSQPSQSGAPQGGAVKTPPQNGKQQGNSDERGTEKAPLIVKIQNAPKSQAEAEQDADYQQRKAADERNFELGIWAIGVGAAQTVALVITFLVIAYVGVRQLRAYMYPDVMRVKKFSLVEPIEVTVVWKNCGQTPAKRFETHGLVWIADLPMADETDFEKTAPSEPEIGRHSTSTVYPGTERRIDYTPVTSRPMPKEVADAVAAGQFAIYVVGQAFYRDVFGCRRKSQICQYIAPEDAAVLIKAERENLELKDFEVRFVAAHVLNDFT